MRIIRRRKIYDTKISKEMVRYHLHNRNNISWFDEALYLTNNGCWFVAGEGGPLSAYGIDLGRGEKEGGKKLVPMSIDEVITWLEIRCEYALLEAHFSDYLEYA